MVEKDEIRKNFNNSAVEVLEEFWRSWLQWNHIEKEEGRPYFGDLEDKYQKLKGGQDNETDEKCGNGNEERS